MQALAAEPKSLPRLRVDTVAEVAGAWTTCDEAVISATRDFHVWTPDYLVKRWALCCVCGTFNGSQLGMLVRVMAKDALFR